MNKQETIAAGKGTLEPLVVRLSDSVTIIQGDCRAVLPVECDAIVTDPPYGIAHPCNFAGRGRDKLAACKKLAGGALVVRELRMAAIP
jgi:23S rRNA G2445 N2-methylase RlmL